MIKPANKDLERIWEEICRLPKSVIMIPAEKELKEANDDNAYVHTVHAVNMADLEKIFQMNWYQ